MLKYRVEDDIWLTSQPDHAAVSGYLIAHWGNEEFTRPGFFADAAEPEVLRAETILAVAEHDNGWWEWEAIPELDPKDGLPLHLTALSQLQGLERWRRGVPRFEGEHPYVALLISLHAYWLQAYRCDPDLDPSFLHPLFGDPGAWPEPSAEEMEETRIFVAQQKQTQETLIARLREDPVWREAVEPRNLYPHTRLLQLGDALSLALCFGGQEELNCPGIPRRGWEDLVTIDLSPDGRSRVVCDPYPFDTDPLPVVLRARFLDGDFEPPVHFQSWWHGVPRQNVRFEFCRRSS